MSNASAIIVIHPSLPTAPMRTKLDLEQNGAEESHKLEPQNRFHAREWSKHQDNHSADTGLTGYKRLPTSSNSREIPHDHHPSGHWVLSNDISTSGVVSNSYWTDIRSQLREDASSQDSIDEGFAPFHANNLIFPVTRRQWKHSRMNLFSPVK